jgi:hypothetical protein
MVLQYFFLQIFFNNTNQLFNNNFLGLFNNFNYGYKQKLLDYLLINELIHYQTNFKLFFFLFFFGVDGIVIKV